MALFLTERDVAGLLTMELALEAVEEGFKEQAQGRATNAPRTRLRLPEGALNLMSASATGLGAMGLKSYAAAGLYLQLFSTDTGELLALIEASGLSRVRTGAATGVATRYMAREDAHTIGIIGAGYQAESQLEAVCRVRDVRRVTVFSRTRERRERFASEMSARLGLPVSAAGSAEECMRGADVVIAITSSAEPVVRGQWLTAGCHINAAGANHWMRRELDDEAVRRCTIVVTDDLEQAKAECGDLLYPVERGIIRWEQVRALSEVVVGRAPGRLSDADITLFESQGVALEDVVVGMRVYQLARQRGIGSDFS